MAFSPLTNTQIATGQPVAADLWSKTQGNQDDHEVRILTLEGAIGAFLPIQMDIYGRYSNIGDDIGFAFTRITFNLTLNAGRVMALTAGSSGDTEIDIQFKRGVAAFSSVFTTLPKVNFAAGDLAIGTGVLDLTKVNLLAGDILRLDLSSSQVDGDGLNAFLEFSKT